MADYTFWLHTITSKFTTDLLHLDLSFVLLFGLILFGLTLGSVYFMHKCYKSMRFKRKLRSKNGTLPICLKNKSEEVRTCAVAPSPPAPLGFFPRQYRHARYAKELGLQKNKPTMLPPGESVKMHILSTIKPIDSTRSTVLTHEQDVTMEPTDNVHMDNNLQDDVDSHKDLNADSSSDSDSKGTQDSSYNLYNDNNSDVIPDSQESLFLTNNNYNSSDFENMSQVPCAQSMCDTSPKTSDAQSTCDTSPGTSDASSANELYSDISNMEEPAKVHICQKHTFICAVCGIDYVGNGDTTSAMTTQCDMSNDAS